MQTYASFRGGSAATRFRLALYYVQRIVTSRTLRRIGHRVLVAALRAGYRSQRPLRARQGNRAAGLRDAGCLRLGRVLSQAQCDDMLRYLEELPMIDARGSGRRFCLRDAPPDAAIGDYPLATIVDCPHLLQLANDPAIVGVVSDYLGFTPTIVSLGLRWSFPDMRADRPTDAVQRFHRDSEPGSAKLLIYLTDVDAACGPHVYVHGTHRERMAMRLHPYADEDVARRYGAAAQTIEGEAGTAFLIDTRGIHKGAAPLHKPRLLLGIQYALLPCFLYEYAPVQCRQAGQFDRYINRLMIAGDAAAPLPVPGFGAAPADEPVREPTPAA